MNAYEWFVLIVFFISTPAFIWFMVHEYRRRRRQQ